MLTGHIINNNSDGTITLRVDSTTEQFTRAPMNFGNCVVGIQYGPALTDMVYIETISNIYNVPINGPVPLECLGRKLPDGSSVPLKTGEMVLYALGGQQIFFDVNGNIELMPGPGGQINLNALDSNSRPIARQGDSVVGDKIQTSQTTVVA